MYQFIALNQAVDAVAYEQLTYPSYRSLLKNLTAENSVLALGVNFAEEPVGLILAAYFPHQDPGKTTGSIYSVFVTPEHRRQGLGKTLLTRMEDRLKERGCTKVDLDYIESAKTLAFHRLLQENNWSRTLQYYACYASREKALQVTHPNLLHYCQKLIDKLPADYTIVPWQEVTPEEREEIQEKQKTDEEYRRYDPFLEEDIIDHFTSLALRYQGKVIGWLTTHRIAPDTIRYTRMFVNPELQPISRSMTMLGKAVILNLEHPEVRKATFIVNPKNKSMVKFTHRRIAPFLDAIYNSWYSEKLLID